MSSLRRLALAAGLAAGAAIVAAGGALVVENHDPACAWCHLPPEEAFVERAAVGEAIDLASAHAVATDTVRCIHCHGGTDVADRLSSLRLAASDTLAFASGRYVIVGLEYAPLGGLSYPLADGRCLACHGLVLEDDAFANHFHYLLTDGDAPAELVCTNCHDAHAPRPGAEHFLTDISVTPGCDACHLAMGGPSTPFDTTEGESLTAP